MQGLCLMFYPQIYRIPVHIHDRLVARLAALDYPLILNPVPIHQEGRRFDELLNELLSFSLSASDGDPCSSLWEPRSPQMYGQTGQMYGMSDRYGCLTRDSILEGSRRGLPSPVWA